MGQGVDERVVVMKGLHGGQGCGPRMKEVEGGVMQY